MKVVYYIYKAGGSSPITITIIWERIVNLTDEYEDKIFFFSN